MNAPGIDNPLVALAGMRTRLKSVAEDMQWARQNVQKNRSDAVVYAGIATIWASVIMTTDILRVGTSAFDRRAKVLFSAQDRAVVQANKVLKALGRRQIQTREDLLKSLDPNLRQVANLAGDVQRARQFLQKIKINLPKEANVVVDLVIAMTQDTALMLQPGLTAQQVQTFNDGVLKKIDSDIEKIQRRILNLDQEIFRLCEVISRTA